MWRVRIEISRTASQGKGELEPFRRPLRLASSNVLDIDRRQLNAIRAPVQFASVTKQQPAKRRKSRSHRPAPPVARPVVEDPFAKAMRLMRVLSRDASFGDGSKVPQLERQIDRLLAESLA